MDRASVQRWLDSYIAAWRANTREAIIPLFTDDVVYRYAPYGEDAIRRGVDALADGWLGEPDDPTSWEAQYEPYAVEGDRAVAVGQSRYFARDGEPERVYQNVFLMRFADDGRCAEFTELYMREGAKPGGN